ncbi:hypothetical protein [Clostridium gasigenes]|uniref:hypothetical protein n=1 Tax=Clostridium gasigenes TaxID=94869 RepID=UPI001C0CE07A|nr:hypothetical protein [Clostridium gasigenes]MBU3103942.1 hypothetical protein [Clostridium gasigenes]
MYIEYVDRIQIGFEPFSLVDSIILYIIVLEFAPRTVSANKNLFKPIAKDLGYNSAVVCSNKKYYKSKAKDIKLSLAFFYEIIKVSLIIKNKIYYKIVANI